MTKVKALEKNDLKKHVSIIHCSNNLSLLQRKISNILLFHAYPFLKTQEEYKISISELCKYLEYHGYNYDIIKQALKALIATVIEWNVFGDDIQDEDWTASTMLASVNIKKAVCTYAYSPRMKRLLYSPVMYGVVDLTTQSQFTSSYGLALYENCSRYRKLKRTRVFTLDQFRKLMGVSNAKYLIFRDFKRRVIDKAVEEVNSLSDLSVEVNISKIGQKVTGLCFSILEKKEKNNLVSLYNNIYGSEKKNESLEEKTLKSQSLIEEKLREIYCLSEQTINNLIQKYGVDKLENKTKQIESTQSFINGNILNIAGFLVDALRKNYTPNKSAKAILEEKRALIERKVNEAERLTLKQNKIRINYDKHIDEQVSAFINETSKEYLKELLIQFKIFLENKEHKIIYDKFKKHGLTIRLVRVFFKNFLQEKKPEIASKFISFEQYSREIE